jgi:coenzyme Q-binding protein COQ10
VIEKVGATLPFSCEQMFDIAADIERYPDFLSWWISARISRRDADVCYVTQVVGAGPIRLAFDSKAVLQRPSRIDVTSTDAPFRQYALSWIVSPLPVAGCRISVAAEIELQSKLLQRVLNGLLPGVVADIVSAFDARAHGLYGTPTDVVKPHGT